MATDIQGNVLIVWDRIGDYHRARLRELENRIGQERVYSADFGGSDSLYGWKNTKHANQHFVLSDRPVDKSDVINRIRAFRRILKDEQIKNVAVAGYGRLEYILFILYARLRGCRVTLFAESWYGKSRLKNFYKKMFLKAFCHTCFVSGIRARDHFHQHLKIPLPRIYMGYSVVDNTHFAPCESVREPVLLGVARFSPEKNLKRLISAFLGSKLSQSYRLRLIGGGSQEDQLRQLAGDSPKIEFVGWIGYEDLPNEYASASYFILPSLFEPWGLVVNEAMAAGLPVITSDACGCQPDLVTKENGFVFNAEDSNMLVSILDTLPKSGGSEWQSMSNRSKEIIARFSCQHWADQLIRSFN